DAVEHGGRPVQGGVEADHAERAGAPGDQGAGGRVRPVAEFGDRGQHAVPGLRLDVGVRVEYPGDRLVRYPRQARYVGHDWRPGTARSCWRHLAPPWSARADGSARIVTANIGSGQLGRRSTLGTQVNPDPRTGLA